MRSRGRRCRGIIVDASRSDQQEQGQTSLSPCAELMVEAAPRTLRLRAPISHDGTLARAKSRTSRRTREAAAPVPMSSMGPYTARESLSDCSGADRQKSRTACGQCLSLGRPAPGTPPSFRRPASTRYATCPPHLRWSDASGASAHVPRFATYCSMRKLTPCGRHVMVRCHVEIVTMNRSLGWITVALGLGALRCRSRISKAHALRCPTA